MPSGAGFSGWLCVYSTVGQPCSELCQEAYSKSGTYLQTVPLGDSMVGVGPGPGPGGFLVPHFHVHSLRVGLDIFALMKVGGFFGFGGAFF